MLMKLTPGVNFITILLTNFVLKNVKHFLTHIFRRKIQQHVKLGKSYIITYIQKFQYKFWYNRSRYCADQSHDCLVIGPSRWANNEYGGLVIGPYSLSGQLLLSTEFVVVPFCLYREI